MIRSCIIGDSHVGSLLEAKVSDAIADTHRLTFFTAPGHYFPALKSRNGRLFAEDREFAFLLQSHSGGKEEIVLADYDEFIVMGLDMFSGLVVSYYREFLFDSAYDRLRGDMGDRYVLSDACFLAVCESVLSKTEAVHVAEEIRRASDRPVTVVAAPNPGTGLSESELPEGYPPFHALVREGTDAPYAKIFEDVCEHMAIKHRLRILPPLREAAKNGAFNLFDYSLLSQLEPDASREERLNAAVHGNDRYGKLLIDRLFRSST